MCDHSYINRAWEHADAKRCGGGFTYQSVLEITNYHYDHVMSVCYMRSEG